MDISGLNTEFKNYFYTLKHTSDRPFNPMESQYTGRNNNPADRIDFLDKINNISEAEKGIKVTISEPKVSINEKVRGESSTYITQPGSIIRRDTPPDLSSTDPLANRITMATIRSDEFIPEDDQLQTLLQMASDRKIDLSGIGSIMGINNQELTSSFFKGRTEMGEYNGSGVAVSESGEVVAYLTGLHPPSRIESITDMRLNVETDLGNEISIEVTISDSHNENYMPDPDRTHIGIARDLEFSFTSEKTLSDDERESVSKILEALNPLINSFHENLTVSKGDLQNITDLKPSLAGIKSLNLSLSTLEGRQSLVYEITDNDSPEISSKSVSYLHYRGSARELSSTATSLGQYDGETYQNLWEKIENDSDESWKRDIISDASMNFDYSSRAYVASQFG